MTITPKIRVLLSAYQCGAGMGSVSQIGWEWYLRLSKPCEVTLLTHVRNRSALEAAGSPTEASFFTQGRIERHPRFAMLGIPCARRFYIERIPCPIFPTLAWPSLLLRALETKGYTDPTPIQKQAIPALAARPRPAGHCPDRHRQDRSLLAAVAPPPRRQSQARAERFVPHARAFADPRTRRADRREHARLCQVPEPRRCQCVFGGIPVGKQARALVGGCDVLVATPGRLLDLIDQRALTLRNVEIFVLDEADQMMDLGFIVPLKRVAAMLPKERQSLFFSATMPKAIADLGKQFINNPVRVEVTPQATTAERVDQFVTFINQAEKQALLTPQPAQRPGRTKASRSTARWCSPAPSTVPTAWCAT